ncbi:MAG: transketolase [Actinobacteria bacterium]|nr:transketolase [Actinomycetota bacterium]
MATDADLERLAINTVRGLAMDAPHLANSGHQGTAMALAPLAHVLFTRVMRYDASTPDWPDRDRFVLSIGHASILLYSMLHLCGFGLELDDLRQFRQWDSLTPGHPEVHHTRGVEVTTGPLGQGFANGVGLALAERISRGAFGADLVDHTTWVICGDGDLSEGISHEAASLAGHLKLGNLVCVYDDNHVTIDGPTELALTDDPVQRFEAYGWHVTDVGEIADDLDGLETALRAAQADTAAPSMIVLRSHIAHPSPGLTDSPKAHGLAFTEDEIAATKQVMGLDPTATFAVPGDVLEFYRSAGVRGAKARTDWQERLDALEPTARGTWDAAQSTTGTTGWQAKLPTFPVGDSIATRNASNKVLDSVADLLPGLVAGAADLTGNTGVNIAGSTVQEPATPSGTQVHYGIREHAMGAIANGMALHGGTVPVVGTFFVFSDYMRPAVRLAALSGAKVIYSWTHDSIGVGEDGPTHQPIEHLASLRAMPGLRLIRPADANETAAAWRIAIESAGPTALILTRQNVEVLEGTGAFDDVARGAYTLSTPSDGRRPDVVLIGTGSEVSLCCDAARTLTADGLAVGVVSMPSWDLFEAQPAEYRDRILLQDVPTLAVEAGVSFGWDRWADDVVAIDHFGASAPAPILFEQFGFSPDNIAERARTLVDARRTDKPKPT